MAESLKGLGNRPCPNASTPKGLLCGALWRDAADAGEDPLCPGFHAENCSGLRVKGSRGWRTIVFRFDNMRALGV